MLPLRVSKFQYFISGNISLYKSLLWWIIYYIYALTSSNYIIPGLSVTSLFIYTPTQWSAIVLSPIMHVFGGLYCDLSLNPFHTDSIWTGYKLRSHWKTTPIRLRTITDHCIGVYYLFSLWLCSHTNEWNNYMHIIWQYYLSLFRKCVYFCVYFDF